MNEGTWLRDVLRRAAEARPVPPPGDRVAGVLRVVRRRRRTRLVAASCTAAATVFAAAALTGGGLVTTGLEPADTASTRTATPKATRLPEVGAGPLTAAGGGRAGGGTSGPAPATAPAGTAARPAAAGKPAFDVYVLLDATSGMSRWDRAVRDAVDDVTRRLAATTTLRHGYGLFRDREGLWLTHPDLYEQLSPVRANGGRLPKIAYSGGGDRFQGHTYGLDGALGIEHFPYTVDPPPAGFGAEARKLVLLVSDAPVNQGDGYPSIDQAIANLDAAGVAVVVLWVENLGHVDPQEAYDDMARFARGTGATARRSLDCDGDRIVDIRRGRPLVCPFATTGNFAAFADAIVARFG